MVLIMHELLFEKRLYGEGEECVEKARGFFWFKKDGDGRVMKTFRHGYAGRDMFL